MDAIDANFHHLGEVFCSTLSSCSGKELNLHPYSGSDGSPSGFRAEVPMDGWSAGFFFWRYPQGLKGVFHLLECRVRFPGVRDMVFPFYNVLHQVAPRDFRCCCLSQISTEQEMTDSVRWLWSVVSSREQEITALAADPSPLVRRQREEISDYYQEDIFSACSDVISQHDNSPDWKAAARKRLHLQLSGWYSQFHARLTGPVYAAFLTGRFQQALPVFHKGPLLSEYEVALAAYMTTHTTLEEQVLSEGLTYMMLNHPKTAPASASGNQAARPQSSVSNGFLLKNALLAGLIQMPFWSLFFYFLYLLVCRWAGQGMAVVLGHHWEDPILGGFLVSFTTSFLLLPEVLQWRSRKSSDKERMLAVAEHYRAPQIVKLFQGFRMAAVTLTTIYLFFSAYTGLALSQYGLYDRSAMGNTTGVYYPYSSVECVRYRAFGSVLSEKYYEIVLSNGETLVLGEDFGISASAFEKEGLPLFEAAGVPVEREG